MNLIHIVGSQNSGKTTLIVDLLKEFKKRNLQIGTLKHSRRAHELDQPGKDSFLHREAGGNPAAIVTANQMAVYLPRDENVNLIDKLAPFFSDTDLILIEGYIDGPGKKIEVWREVVGNPPLVLEREDIEAVVTNDTIKATLPILSRADVKGIADYICTIAGIKL